MLPLYRVGRGVGRALRLLAGDLEGDVPGVGARVLALEVRLERQVQGGSLSKNLAIS